MCNMHLFMHVKYFYVWQQKWELALVDNIRRSILDESSLYIYPYKWSERQCRLHFYEVSMECNRLSIFKHSRVQYKSPVIFLHISPSHSVIVIEWCRHVMYTEVYTHVFYLIKEITCAYTFTCNSRDHVKSCARSHKQKRFKYLKYS